MSDEIIVALVTGAVTVVTQMLTLLGVIYMNRNVSKTHDAVNSKMTELLRITANAARAEGRLEGPDAHV